MLQSVIQNICITIRQILNFNKLVVLALLLRSISTVQMKLDHCSFEYRSIINIAEAFCSSATKQQ